MFLQGITSAFAHTVYDCCNCQRAGRILSKTCPTARWSTVSSSVNIGGGNGETVARLNRRYTGSSVQGRIKISVAVLVVFLLCRMFAPRTAMHERRLNGLSGAAIPTDAKNMAGTQMSILFQVCPSTSGRIVADVRWSLHQKSSVGISDTRFQGSPEKTGLATPLSEALSFIRTSCPRHSPSFHAFIMIGTYWASTALLYDWCRSGRNLYNRVYATKTIWTTCNKMRRTSSCSSSLSSF